MDIRKFFKTGDSGKRKHSSPSPPGAEDNVKKEEMSSPLPGPSKSLEEIKEVYNEYDIGNWLGKVIPAEKKRTILMNCWKPPPSYDFSSDAKHLKRKFMYAWLDKYSPWLVYSKRMKGSFCLYCVLFPQANVQGVQGSFAIRPFTKYKNVHEYCKTHVESRWHLEAAKSAKSFLEDVPVNVQVLTGHQMLLEENRKLVKSIISTIIFCGVHDLPLRGKELHEGIFEDLIRLKIDSGDTELKRLTEGTKHYTYKSPKIQNELIQLCGEVISDLIISDAKKAFAFSVLADESADISGKEQLSIGVRFFDEQKMIVREEFIGFVELEGMDAKTIANAIDCFLDRMGFDPEKCVGQGYDGCSTMAGKDSGVQKIIREKYKKALYFHCASHRLNLVVNDLNSVPEIRNTISTIKDIINFFRESVLRRKYIPNVPGLCETRWSEKYRSISIFKKHFIQIVQALERLAGEGNNATKRNAFQLHCAATKPVFIISTCIISKYSAILEPVVNILQSKNLDLLQCSNHIKNILALVKTHRESPHPIMNEIYICAKEMADELLVELELPRIIKHQQHRSNPPATSDDEYWMRSVLIPYLDSFSISLANRFSPDNTAAFSVLSLHPSLFLDFGVVSLKQKMKVVAEFYELDNVESEIDLWFNLWKEKKIDHQKLKDLELAEVIKEATMFYPSIRKAFLISLAHPCSTSTIERTFSTLRRVKTWTRSTMTSNRLNGLCLMSVHRKLVLAKKEEIELQVVRKFAENPRKLLL